MDALNAQHIHVTAVGSSPTAATVLRHALDSAPDLDVVASSHRLDGFANSLKSTDVLIFDHRLQGNLASRLLRALDQAGFEQPKVIVNTPDDPAVIIRYMESGAMGCVRSRESVSCLHSTIRDVVTGRARLDPVAAGILLARMDELRRRTADGHTFTRTTEPYILSGWPAMSADTRGSIDDRIELEIAGAPTRAEAVSIALNYLCQRFDQSAGLVCRRNGACDALVLDDGAGEFGRWKRPAPGRQVMLEGPEHDTDGGPFGRVYVTGKPWWTVDREGLDSINGLASVMVRSPRSVAVAPIPGRDGVAGVIELFGKDETEPSLEFLEALEITGRQLGFRFRRSQ